jgi:mycoredoxin
MQQSHAFAEQKTIKMYATPGCGDCRMAKRWLDSHGIPYEYINIVEDERAVAYVVRVNRGMQSVPTIVFPDGSILVEPSARELAAKCSLDSPPTLGQRIRGLLQELEKRPSEQATPSDSS